MLANYGYKDGSGEYYITIDTNKCDGCAKCVIACPYGVFEVGKDEANPLREEPVVKVTDEQRKKIGYTCTPCKRYLTSTTLVHTADMEEIQKLACVVACVTGAINHSW